MQNHCFFFFFFLQLSTGWNEDSVISLFTEDKSVGCVAYPLRASNRQYALPQFQDLEYLTAGFMKIAQVMKANSKAIESRQLKKK